jgi:hypothetical protein
MVDYTELMEIFSRPRPNGSPGERLTSQAIQRWLAQRGIPHRIHHFRQYPYFFESIGIWLMLSRTLLAAAIWFRWGWITLPIALIGAVGGLIDMWKHVPLVSFFGARRAENILIEFEPSVKSLSRREAMENQPRQSNPDRELVLSAHYDSKTEPLDHMQRMTLLLNVPFGLVITLALGVLGPLDARFLAQGSAWADFTYFAGLVLCIPLLLLAWGLGLNLSLGRLYQPSLGAVDNGTSCAILLGLAKRLHENRNNLQRTRITLAVFSGEEIGMQGSRAYVRDRDWPLQTIALNLEAMAQDGQYVYWEKDGNLLKLDPTSAFVNSLVSETVSEVVGEPAIPGGPVLSDGSSFMATGIPTAVMGTYHSIYKDRGFHQPSDNLDRVQMHRLVEGVEILTRFIEKLDRKEESFLASKNLRDRET